MGALKLEENRKSTGTEAERTSNFLKPHNRVNEEHETS